MLDMRNQSRRLLIVLVFLIPSLAQVKTPQGSKQPTQTVANLQMVELADKYRIQVPGYFKVVFRGPDRIRAAPTYFFSANSPHYTTIRVYVLPYTGIIEIDPDTRKVKLPGEFNGGPPLKNYFTISGNRDVYYGWSVTDNDYECTMNSPCPHSSPPGFRYTTWYSFVLFDKPNNSIVEFEASHIGRDSDFEGDGKLLRDEIVPSLTSIR